jgi:aminoglycoside phosphotransferase (APT) family kinase protein
LGQLAPQLATLRVREARPFDDAQFERELEPHFEATLANATRPETRRAVEALRERARRALAGLALPRVLAHADLRAKHVQIGRDGRVNGWLDWGTAVESGLPGLDLLHHFVHDRKQLLGHPDGASWRTFLDPQGPTAGERAAFGAYARALDLDLEALRTVALVYPALVCATAVRNWSLARPGWFGEHFQM